MKGIKSIFLPVVCLGLLFSSVPAHATKGEIALKTAKTVGSALATVASKTFGWTFGLGQTVLGGAVLAAGGFGAYTLFNAHKRNELQHASSDKAKENLIVMGATAVAIPLGLILAMKGMRNIWNA